MSGLDVLIELAERPAAAEVRQLTAACGQSIERGVCRVAGPKTMSDSARALAIVGPGAAPDTVQISVGVPGQKRDAWTVQTLRFAPADGAQERWRSVGFAIGAMAGVAADAAEAAKPIESVEAVEPAREREVTPTAPKNDDLPVSGQKASQGRLGVVLLVSQGFRGEELAWGASAEAGYRVSDRLELRVVGAGARGRAASLDLVGWWLDLGVGMSFGWQPWRRGPELSVVGVGLIHWLRVSAQQEQPPASDSGSRFLPGLRLGLEISGSPAERIDVRFGAGARLLSDDTLIQVGPSTAAESPALSGFLGVGVGYLF